MTQEANKKIEVVLSKILDGYCLSKKYNYCLEYSVAGLLKDSGINESELGLILSQLEEKKLINNFSESGNDNVIAEDTYTIYFPDDFVVKAKASLQDLVQIDLPVKIEESKTKTQFLEEKGALYILAKGKKARLSDDVKSKKAQLVKTLSDPLGVPRTIDSVVESIKSPKDNYDEYTDKKKIITETFKDINRTLKSEKSPVRLRPKIKNGSVCMVVDERKSG